MEELAEAVRAVAAEKKTGLATWPPPSTTAAPRPMPARRSTAMTNSTWAGRATPWQARRF